MSRTKRVAVGAAVVLALGACKRGEPVRAASADPTLQQDIQLASSAGVDLASAQRRTGTQVVSAEELVPVARREARAVPASRAPRRAPVAATRAPRPEREREAPAPEPTQAAAPAPAPEPAPQVAEAPAPEPTPEPAPAPVPGPASGQAGNGDDGRSNGPRIPRIGVVIRGGDVGDDDHCQLPPGGRRGGGAGVGIGIGGVLINVRMPMGQPTFPGRPRW